MKLICIKIHDRDGTESDFVEISLNEVNYIYAYRPIRSNVTVPAYHTKHGSYVGLRTLKDIAKGYARFGFRSYDNSTIVNENLLSQTITDKTGTTLCFDDGSVVRIRAKL